MTPRGRLGRHPRTKIVVSPDGVVRWPGGRAPCALGRGGVRRTKREGDGATPAGNFPLREVFYRADRVIRPETKLLVRAIRPEDGWCDDPDDPLYNRLVRLPYPARHERLWREDSLYDLLVVVGHNDDPVEPGRGSAVFLHVAKPDGAPTEGCVALRLPDLQALLRALREGDRIEIVAL